jgi:hypothetical protein
MKAVCDSGRRSNLARDKEFAGLLRCDHNDRMDIKKPERF